MTKATRKDERRRCLQFQKYLITYKITDYNGEVIQGSFYDEELQKTSQKSFLIEKILNRRGDKSLVKWMGYPKLFNSWIDTKTMVKLTPDKSL